jgi:hypothetical protein
MPSSRRRHPHLHAALQTLTIDEFAALGSQEQEDEDEALRLQSPKEGWHPGSGTEVFGILEQATEGIEPVSDEEGEEEETTPPEVHVTPSHQPSSSRTLFPTTPAPTPSAASCLSRRSVLGLNNHAYGHTLLLIHELSSKLATLPLSSAFSSHQVATSGGSQDPRLILHKDCILLASDQLSPNQKLQWILHVRHAYAFLAPP